MRRQIIAWGLPILLAFQLVAQEAPRIEIRILEGEGALNNIKRKVAHNPSVMIVDAGGKPVSGADVTFTTPFSGASALIQGARTWKGQSDAEGRVAVSGMVPNEIEGRFLISVEAIKDGVSGRTVIPQSNTLAGGRGAGGSGNKKLLWGILAAAGGGAAIGFATMGGGSKNGGSGGSSGTSLSVGGVTVGGPR